MFRFKESELIEDNIKNKTVLQLYKALNANQWSSSREDFINILNDDLVVSVCQIILNLSIDSESSKLSSHDKEAFQKLSLEREEAQVLVIVAAATLNHIFVIDNFTGPRPVPSSDRLAEVYKQMEVKFDFRSLTNDEHETYHLITNPWLLKGACLCWHLVDNMDGHLILGEPSELEFLVLKHRYMTTYLSVLHEHPEALLKELRHLQDFIFEHHILNELSGKTQLLRFNKVELCCELIQTALLIDGVSLSRRIFDYASSISGVSIEHTGVLGKRTRFQQNDIPQLVVRVSKDEQEGCYKPSLEIPKFEPELSGLPKDIELDDDTLLPDISFIGNETKPFNAREQELSVEAQLLMLTKLDLILKEEVMEESLKDEWTSAYLRSTIQSSTIWAVKCKSLAHRSVVEKKNMRKVDRALLQLEQLVKETNEVSHVGLNSLRMKSFYSVLPNSKWQIERLLGDISFDLCLYKNALEIYSRIEHWEGMIKCHSALGETSKAEMVIRQQLDKQETPYLYCLLGDVTDDIQFYERSWLLSKCRFARPKKSIGTYYYTRKNYSEAIENYELALEASPFNVSILSLLAYSCLLSEKYDRAAECYQRIVTQDDSNFLAWNNLAKAYLKLNRKHKAWRMLQEAIRCNWEEPKIWENFMLVSAEIGAIEYVMDAWHRLIEIKGSHKDDQILGFLTSSIIELSHNTTERHLLKKGLELVGRISSTASSSSRLWICYLRLLIRQHEMTMQESVALDTSDRKINQHVDKEQLLLSEETIRVGKIKNCLQRATPTTMVSDPNWHQSLRKIDQILDSFNELIDCYDLSFSTIGQRQEIWTQWKYFKLSIRNFLKTLKRNGYDADN